MQKIPTLYSNYDEIMLDIDVYGKKVLSPQLTIPQLRDKLFEDFKRSKPLPTLTSRRYELSNLVSEDYKILYIKELELQENEREMNLRESKPSNSFNFDFDNLEPIAKNVQNLFTYESRTTDSAREEIMRKYNLETGEFFERGIAETEKIFGSTKEDTSLILSDEEVEQLGQDLESVKVEDSSKFVYSEEDTDEDGFIDFTDDSDTDELETPNSSDEVYSESDDDDYPDFDDEEYTEDDEDVDYSDDDSDDDYPDFDDDEEEDEEDEDSYEGVDSDDDDDYPDFDDEETEEDDDYIDFTDVDDEESHSISDNTLTKVDEDFSDFEMTFEESERVVTPITPVEIKNDIKKVEVVDRSSEPTDIRQFLRKYPRSTVEFVSKYFTKKQINDALKIGKIIKRGNILKLP